MKAIQNLSLKLACLVFASFSSLANAVTLTNKITAISTYGNTTGNYYMVKVGGYELITSVPQTGDLAREAFLRKLTVIVDFDLGTFIPNYGYVGNKLNKITLQSIDLP